MKSWGFIALLALASTARALPVDRTLELTVGEVRFLRLNFVEAAEVDTPEVCTVERMPSLELLLTPKQVGTALLYIFEEGRLEVYRLRVGTDPMLRPSASARQPAEPASSAKTAAPAAEPPTAAQWKAARSACPLVEERTVEGEKFLHLDVPDGVCRAAVLPLLASDLYPADHLRLLFGGEALQAQVADMQARLAAVGLKNIPLGYEAATLALKGKMDAATRHKLLRAIWPAAVGRLDLDDETQDPDGGGW
jgi:hypothetical protein